MDIRTDHLRILYYGFYDFLHMGADSFTVLRNQIFHTIHKQQGMYLLFKTVCIFNYNIDTLFQGLIRINTILYAFPIALNRRNRRFQIMRNIMNHFFLRLFLLSQLLTHTDKGICQLSYFIAAIDPQGGILTNLDTFNIVSYLIQRMNQCQYPHHHDDEEEADHNHGNINDTVD